MTLQEFIETTDVGMGDICVMGCTGIFRPTVSNLRKNENNIWNNILYEQIYEWYISRDALGEEMLTVYLKKQFSEMRNTAHILPVRATKEQSMLLHELIDTTDKGMEDYRLMGCTDMFRPTLKELKEKPEVWLNKLNSEVREWYTCELPPKSGRKYLNVYLKNKTH